MGHAFDSHAKGPTRRDQLTGAQRCLLDHILLRTYEIAVREVEMERADPEGYARSQYDRSPRHVFYIDGARGSGKTTLLLTAREYLDYLGRGDESEDWSNTPNHISTAFRDIRSEMDNSNITLGLPKNLREDSILSSAHRSAKGALKKTALVFPVLFPSDLDEAQPIMEGLFAFMEEKLVAEIRNPHGCNESTLQRTREERAKEGERLRQQLYKDVTKSWFLSKQEGIEAILRDSHNYEKFLENRGRASGQSYRRVDDWRQYVVEYLDYFGAQLLAVPIDDTDVTPQVSTDILHTLRIFLDHPRIVTIVAGNLRTLRQDLVWRSMSEVRSSMQALSASDTATAFAWRRFLRRQIEEYLDKVIPRPQRQYLKLNSFPPGDGKYKSDFERFLPSKSLDEYCLLQIRFWQKRFYEANIKANRRWINRKRETDSQYDRITLEHLLAWWLLRHRYKDELGPRTPRELQTFVSYSSHDKELPFSAFKRYKGWQEKRLAVILFENAANYELIHRLEDGDVLLEWLSRQDLASEWVGHRSFSLDGRKISEGTYSYNYICYRLDLGMAIPLRENHESEIPEALLPRPAGRNLSDRPPFFPIHWQPKTTRLHDALSHSVIPANCVSMYDLQCLPDIAWRRKDTDNPWRPSLIYKWPDAFDLLAPRLATRAIGNSNGTILAAAEQQGKIEAYFFEVVIPMATLDIGRFVSAPPRTSEKRKFTEQHLLLWHEISQGSQFFKSERQWLDDLRRRIDYISTAEIALDAGETRQLYEQAVSEDLKTFINALRSKGPVGVVLHLVEYQWLLNDVRRAWHAARIFVNHVGEFIEQDAAGRNQAPDHLIRRNFFSRSDRYRVVSLFSLMDEINSFPPLSDFWRKANIDVGNHVQRIKDLSRNHDLVLWEHVTPEQFVQMLIASDSSKEGATVPATAEFSSVRNGLLDIACAESSPFLFSGHHEGFEEARLSRLLFFLLVGLGPCFPAIIHIDVAGTLYAGGNAKARIEEWRNELRKFQVFCFRYRASFERFILRIEHLLEAQTDKKFEEHITGVAVPDWSFSSLGIEGREGMARRSWGQLSDRSDLIELLTGKRPISYTPRSESSLFRDAEGYLNNAQYFLSLIEKIVHSSQISDSQKEGQRL